MDDKLRKDIADHFQRAYVQREKEKKRGFSKFMDRMNDKIDGFFKKGNLFGPGVILLGSVALTAASLPVGVVALGLWTANYGQQIVSDILDNNRAAKAVQADIDNGILPDRYNNVIENNIRGMEEKIALLREQKTQLPEKGSVVKSFEEAVAPEEKVAAKPAPAPKPKHAPHP